MFDEIMNDIESNQERRLVNQKMTLGMKGIRESFYLHMLDVVILSETF